MRKISRHGITMLSLSGLLIFSGLFFSCTTTQSSLADKKNYAETNDEFRRKHEFSADSAEKAIRYGYHYVVSTIPGAFKVRIFHPDQKVMTEEKHYSTSALTLLHGEYKSWWDDGSIREQGFYQFGRKHGIWLEKEPGQSKSVSGEYFNHRKEGIWTQLDTNGMVESVHIWQDGKRHGKFLLYDSAGQKVNEGLYRNDTLIAELFKQPKIVKPYLKNCERDLVMDLKACTDFLLPQFIYGQLKYPTIAKKNKVEGSVLAQWEVGSDGTIHNISVPQSLTNEIRDEVISVIKNMPAWSPATKDGVPVEYTYSLPINFSL